MQRVTFREHSSPDSGIVLEVAASAVYVGSGNGFPGLSSRTDARFRRVVMRVLSIALDWRAAFVLQ